MRKIAGKLLDDSRIKKIKQVKDKDERRESFKHAILSELKLRYHELDHTIKESKEDREDFSFAEAKLRLFKPKLDFFSTTFEEEDLNKILALFQKVKKECEK